MKINRPIPPRSPEEAASRLDTISAAYKRISEQITRLEAEKKKLRDAAFSLIKKFGKPRPDGGKIMNTSGFMTEIVQRGTPFVDEEAADAFFDSHPELLEKVQVWEYDLEKIEELNAMGDIPDKVFAKMIKKKPTEQINIKAKEEK